MSLGRRMRKAAVIGEHQTAGEIGGVRQPGSGSTDLRKGDAVSDVYLVDDKLTSRSSFSVSDALLAKVKKQALQHDLEPVIHVRFLNGRECAILDWQHFLDLLYKRPENEPELTSPSPQRIVSRPGGARTTCPRPITVRR